MARSEGLSLLYSVLERHDIEDIIRREMSASAMEKIAATEVSGFETEDGQTGLMFSVKVKPMRTDGRRSPIASTMTMFLSRNAAERYDVVVRHTTRKAGSVVHATHTDVPAHKLPAILKML